LAEREASQLAKNNASLDGTKNQLSLGSPRRSKRECPSPFPEAKRQETEASISVEIPSDKNFAFNELLPPEMKYCQGFLLHMNVHCDAK
jgi:hypothetical protein